MKPWECWLVPATASFLEAHFSLVVDLAESMSPRNHFFHFLRFVYWKLALILYSSGYSNFIRLYPWYSFALIVASHYATRRYSFLSATSCPRDWRFRMIRAEQDGQRWVRNSSSCLVAYAPMLWTHCSVIWDSFCPLFHKELWMAPAQVTYAPTLPISTSE